MEKSVFFKTPINVQMTIKIPHISSISWITILRDDIDKRLLSMSENYFQNTLQNNIIEVYLYSQIAFIRKPYSQGISWAS